jgi:hypothetical protein
MGGSNGMTTRTFYGLVLAGASLVVIAACASPPPQAAAPAFRLTATIKDIMDSEVDPSADALWESVATIVTKDGTEERQPRTDDEWKTVRRAAITLVEATNLLLMEGRQVAKHGEKSENPGIELEPEEMEKLIAADRVSWAKYAGGLHDAAMTALKAIDAKSAQGLSDAGEGIDQACEACHLHYWYPNTQQAAEAQKKS